MKTKGRHAPAKIGLGMIGCGLRLRTLIKPHPSIKVTALCDPHKLSIQEVLSEYNSEARVYQKHEDLVADPSVDWVAIGSWNCQHKDHAVAALRAGKHVFCEKPLATSLVDCLAIREAAHVSGKLFSFGLVLRYSALYRKVNELLRSGAIGRLISFEFNETLGFNHGGYIFGNWRRFRSNAGTHLLEKCCHDMDLANWMVGSLPVRVASFGGLGFFRPKNRHYVDQIGCDEEGRQAYRTWPGLDQVNPFTSEKDIVDNQVAIMEYANGVRATFHTNCNAGIPERRFYLLGTEGAIRADAFSGIIEVQRVGFDAKPECLDTGVRGGHVGGDEVLRESIYDSMLNGTQPLVGIDEALKSAIVCFGIDQALDEERVIDLRPLWEKAGIAYA